MNVYSLSVTDAHAIEESAGINLQNLCIAISFNLKCILMLDQPGFVFS